MEKGRRYGKGYQSVASSVEKEYKEGFFNFNSNYFLGDNDVCEVANRISTIGENSFFPFQNLSPAVIIIKKYYQLYLTSDMLRNFEKRNLNPHFLKQLKLFYHNKTLSKGFSVSDFPLEIFIIKLDERDERIEYKFSALFHQFCLQKVQYYRTLIIKESLSVLFLICTYSFMMYGGYLALFNIPNNQLIYLFSTFCLQTTMWWFNWQSLDRIFYILKNRYNEYCFFATLLKSRISFQSPR